MEQDPAKLMFKRRMAAFGEVHSKLSKAEWDNIALSVSQFLEKQGWSDFTNPEMLTKTMNLRALHPVLKEQLEENGSEQWEEILVCEVAALFVQVKRMKNNR